MSRHAVDIKADIGQRIFTFEHLVNDNYDEINVYVLEVVRIGINESENYGLDCEKSAIIRTKNWK